MQKTAARIILDAPLTTRSRTIFEDLKWNTPSKRIYEKRMTLVFKALNNMAPGYIKECLVNISSVHKRNLRSTSSNNLFIQGGSTEHHKKRFSYLAAQGWNVLPSDLKCTTSLNIFKRKLNECISSF